MACDGEIHEMEMEELRAIAAETPYFTDLDIETELQQSAKDLEEKGRYFFTSYFIF